MAEAALAAAAASSAGTAAATFSTLATVALVSIYGSIAGSEKTPTAAAPAPAPAPAAPAPAPAAPAPAPARRSRSTAQPAGDARPAPPPGGDAGPAPPPGESPAAVATPAANLAAASGGAGDAAANAAQAAADAAQAAADAAAPGGDAAPAAARAATAADAAQAAAGAAADAAGAPGASADDVAAANAAEAAANAAQAAAAAAANAAAAPGGDPAQAAQAAANAADAADNAAQAAAAAGAGAPSPDLQQRIDGARAAAGAVPVPLPSAPPAEETPPTPTSEETCRERHEDIFNLLKFGTYRGIYVDQMTLTKDEIKQLLREVNFRPGITRMRRSIFGTTLQALLDDCRNPLGLRPVDDIALINRWITFFASLDVPLGYVPSIRYTPLDEAGRRKFTGPAAVAPPAPEAPPAVAPPAPEAPPTTAPPAPARFNVLPPGTRDAYHIIDPQADTRYKQWLNLKGEAPRKHGIPPPPPAEPTPAEESAAKLEEAKKKIATIQSDVEARKAAEAAQLPIGATASGQDPQNITWSRYGAVADGNCFYDSFLYATVPEHRGKSLGDRAVAANAFRKSVRENKAAILPHLRDVYALPTGESPIDDAELGRIFDEEVRAKEYASTQLAMAIARWKGQWLVIINGDSLARDATQIEPAKLVPGASDVPDDTHPAVTLSYLESIQHFEPVSINDQFTVPGAEYPDGLRAILESTQGAVVPVPPPSPPAPPVVPVPAEPMNKVDYMTARNDIAKSMATQMLDSLTAAQVAALPIWAQAMFKSSDNETYTLQTKAEFRRALEEMYKNDPEKLGRPSRESATRRVLKHISTGIRNLTRRNKPRVPPEFPEEGATFVEKPLPPGAPLPPHSRGIPVTRAVVPPAVVSKIVSDEYGSTPAPSPAESAAAPAAVPAAAPSAPSPRRRRGAPPPPGLPPPEVLAAATPLVAEPPVAAPAAVAEPPVAEPAAVAAPAAVAEPPVAEPAAVAAPAAVAEPLTPEQEEEVLEEIKRGTDPDLGIQRTPVMGKSAAREVIVQNVILPRYREIARRLRKQGRNTISRAEFDVIEDGDEQDMYKLLPSGMFQLKALDDEYGSFLYMPLRYRMWARIFQEENRTFFTPAEFRTRVVHARDRNKYFVRRGDDPIRHTYVLISPIEYHRRLEEAALGPRKTRTSSASAPAAAGAPAPAPALESAVAPVVEPTLTAPAAAGAPPPVAASPPRPPPLVAAAALKATPTEESVATVELAPTDNPAYKGVVLPPTVPDAELVRLRRRFNELEPTLKYREFAVLPKEDQQFYKFTNAWAGTGPVYEKRAPPGLFPLSRRSGGLRKKTFKSRRGKKTNGRGTRRRKDRANCSHKNPRRRT
jgi:hypothetical protein